MRIVSLVPSVTETLFELGLDGVKELEDSGASGDAFVVPEFDLRGDAQVGPAAREIEEVVDNLTD